MWTSRPATNPADPVSIVFGAPLAMVATAAVCTTTFMDLSLGLPTA